MKSYDEFVKVANEEFNRAIRFANSDKKKLLKAMGKGAIKGAIIGAPSMAGFMSAATKLKGEDKYIAKDALAGVLAGGIAGGIMGAGIAGQNHIENVKNGKIASMKSYDEFIKSAQIESPSPAEKKHMDEDERYIDAPVNEGCDKKAKKKGLSTKDREKLLKILNLHSK